MRIIYVLLRHTMWQFIINLKYLSVLYLIFFKLYQLWSIFINQKFNVKIASRKVLICSKYSNKHRSIKISYKKSCFVFNNLFSWKLKCRLTSRKSREQIQVAVAIHAIPFSLAKSTHSFNIRSNESTGMMTITAATSAGHQWLTNCKYSTRVRPTRDIHGVADNG